MTDAFGSYLHALAPIDLDRDGTDELAIAVGPPHGYGLRVLSIDGPAEVEVELWPFAFTVGLARVAPVRGAPTLVAAVTPRHPSRFVFPEGDHRGAAPGVYVLRWTGQGFETERFVPARRRGGELAAPRDVHLADLDGDGDEDVLVPCENAETIALLRDGDRYAPVAIGGITVLGVAQGDADPAAEPWVDARGRAFRLGVGDRPASGLVPVPPRARVALRDDDPAWNAAARLEGVGLVEAAADAFAAIGRAHGDAAAWAEAARLRERRQDLRGAAEAWREAARGGDPIGRERAAALSDARLASAEGARVIDFAGPPGPAWALRAPLARWNPGGWLDLETTIGAGSVARLPLRRAEGPVGLRARLRIERMEWAHGLRLALVPEAGSPLSLFVQTGGGGGFLRREVGADDSTWVMVDDPDPQGPHLLDVALVVGADGELRLDVAWDDHPPVTRALGPAPATDASGWRLDVTPLAQGFHGPYGAVALDEVQLRGFTVDERPLALDPPDAEVARALEVARLRIDPATRSAELLRARGLAATLALVDDGWSSALAMHGAERRVLNDLVYGLPLLADDAAARLAPELVAWRGWALLRDGFVDAAERELARALAHAGDAGEACLLAHAGLAAIARAHGGDPTEATARAVACAPARVLGERRVARLLAAWER